MMHNAFDLYVAKERKACGVPTPEKELEEDRAWEAGRLEREAKIDEIIERLRADSARQREE